MSLKVQSPWMNYAIFKFMQFLGMFCLFILVIKKYSKPLRSLFLEVKISHVASIKLLEKIWCYIALWHNMTTMRMDMVNMWKRQQPHWDEKCQLKAIHGSSMIDEETLTPQGRLKLAPKTTLYIGTAKRLPQNTPATYK